MVLLSRRRGPERSYTLASIFLCLTALLDTAKAIPTISVTGNKFFDSDGNQFIVNGVFYDVNPDVDVFSTPDQCEIDAKLMKELGINTIRVRNLKKSTDSTHDGCMSAFENAGIYALIHLHDGLSGVSPSSPTWNEFLFSSFRDIMDTFAKYDNVLAFIADNVKTAPAGATAAPYLKAAVTDMRRYRDSKGYRNFPVGYAEGVGSDMVLGQYMTCGEDSVDFYGMNGDPWCDTTDAAEDSLKDYAIYASEFNVPVIEANVGCSETDIILEHVKAIREGSLSEVYSGGSVYNWVNADDVTNPHLVTIPDDDFDDDKPVTPTENDPYYTDFQKVLEDSKPSLTAKSDYTNTPTAPAACPTSNKDWTNAISQTLPTLMDAPATATAGTDSVDGAEPDRGEGEPAEESSSGLSTGAKIAIGVGVSVPIVCIIGAIIFFVLFRRRRRERKRTQELAAQQADLSRKDPPAHMQRFYEKEQPDQIPPRPELGQEDGFGQGQHPPRELEGARFVGELADTSLPGNTSR